jgi:hypothetical protein
MNISTLIPILSNEASKITKKDVRVNNYLSIYFDSDVYTRIIV